MEKHFRSLVDPANRGWTVSFFLLGVILVAGTANAGAATIPAGDTLLYNGITFLFLTFIHTGQINNVTNTPGIVEKMMFITAVFVCFPGILIGIVGAFYRGVMRRSKEKQ
jgi:hypothetical protein